jgi:peptidoglycan/xylan/chitin deacetylase (PgdA/CDA1 family)
MATGWVAFRRRFVPILAYHALSDDPAERHPAIVRQTEFVRQMQWLLTHRYRPVPCSLLPPIAAPGANLVGISFDDGFSSLHRLGLPVMRALGVACTTFLSTDYVGGGRAFPWSFARHDAPLSWPQVDDMLAAASEVGSHGCSHAALPGLSATAVARELEESRRAIRSATGADARLLAYPHGAFSRALKRAAAAVGYDAAYAVYAAPGVADRFAIPRMTIRNQTTLRGLQLRVVGIHSYLKSRPWFQPARPALRRWRHAFF